MAVRVELSSATFAGFAWGEGEVRGRLNDMSLTGMSLVMTAEPQIPLSEEGELHVSLPSGPLTVPAKLLKIVPGKHGYRCVFEIRLNRATEKAISKFILQRQVEIVRELKDHPGINPDRLG